MLSTTITLLVFTTLLLCLTFVNVDAFTPFVGAPLITQIEYTPRYQLWRAPDVQGVASYNSDHYGNLNGTFTGTIKCDQEFYDGGCYGCMDLRMSLSRRVYANLQFIPTIRAASSGQQIRYEVQISDGIIYPPDEEYPYYPMQIPSQFGPFQYSDVDLKDKPSIVTDEPKSIVYQWLGQSLTGRYAMDGNRVGGDGNIVGGPINLGFQVCVFGGDAVIDDIEVRAHLNMDPECTYKDNVELLTGLVKPRNQTVCHNLGDGTYEMLPSIDPAALSNRHLDIYGGHLIDVLAGNPSAPCTASDQSCEVLDCFCQPICMFQTERPASSESSCFELGLSEEEITSLPSPLLCDGVLETEVNGFGDVSCCDARCEVCGGENCAARGAAIDAECCSNPISRLGRTCRQTNGLPPCTSNGDPDCKDGTLLSNKACCPHFCKADKAFLTVQAEGVPVNPDCLSVVNGCYVGSSDREPLGLCFTDDILLANKTCSQHVAPCFFDQVRRDNAGVTFWDK
jgi:hypothetical protein